MPRFRLRTLMLVTALATVCVGALIRPARRTAMHATSKHPKVAARQEKMLAGVLWGFSYDQARELADIDGRPILVYFAGINDPNCRRMEIQVFPRPEIVPLLSRFVTVCLYTDYVPIESLTSSQREKLAEGNQVLQSETTNNASTPCFVVLDSDGKALASFEGMRSPAAFATFLAGASRAHRRQALLRMNAR